MKIAKKFLSMLLAVMMLVSIIPISSIEAEAVTLTQSQFDSKLSEVEAKYPDGSQQDYWYVSGSYVGRQCHGYGRWLSWYVWGVDFANGRGTNWTLYKSTASSTDIDKLVPGDVVRYRSSTSKTWNHTIFITKISGNTIYYTDCNSDGECTIKWNQTVSKSTLTSYLKISLYDSSNEAAAYGYIAHYTPNNLTASGSGTHTHAYTNIGYESAHPHKYYYYCSCGKTGEYTGSTKILTSCSTCMTKATKWPVPLKAYTINTGKTTVYDAPGGSAKSNKIYDTDLCTITAIYTNGWCKVTFPLDAGGTDSGYVKTSVFLDPSYSVFTMKASAKLTTYSRSGLGTSIGYAASGDTIYICDHTSTAVQIAYPLTDGGYKVGWLPISKFTYTVKYNANGGSGTMTSSTIKYRSEFTLSANTFTKTGYTFNGWNLYRNSDSKWYASGQGWQTSSAITSNNYTKSKYADSSTWTLGGSWLKGAKTTDTFTFYATWRANVLSVYYNTNGGTISSDTYSGSNNIVYKDGVKLAQKWTYNSALTNGLANASTFGLAKTGYTFSGWGTSSTGGTVFDQNDTGLLPTEINSNIKNGDCSKTLYAIWKANTYTVKYNANGGIGTTASSTHTYDTAKALTANGFTRDGYTFLGWATSSAATTPTYTDKQSVKNLTATSGGTVTLYAVWQKNPVTLSSVSVSSAPNKTEYTVGDAFDASGLVLKATMSDGSTQAITTGYTVSTPDMSSAGTKTVTVTYDEKTTTFEIAVKEKESNNTVIGIAPQTVKAGEIVEIPVYIEKSQMNMGVITFEYDAEKLEYVSATNEFDGAIDVNKSVAGKLTISAVNENGNMPDGVMLTLTFKVTEGISGNTIVLISTNDAYDNEEKEIAVDTVDGEITIVTGDLLGDVNLDGKVNIIDARWLLQNSSGNRTLTAEQAANADVNKDGKINIIDARWLLQVSSGNRVL